LPGFAERDAEAGVMYKVEFDTSQRLLKFSYAQRFTAAEAGQCAAEMRALIPALPSEFRVLADLSGLDAMDLDCQPFIAQVMDLLDQRGVNLVVRVIPDPRKDIGLNIMSVFHYRRSVRFVTCEKLDEAMRILEGDLTAPDPASGQGVQERPVLGATT
jgi:hypothetical protein